MNTCAAGDLRRPMRTAARRCRSAARPTPCNCRPTAYRTGAPRHRPRYARAVAAPNGAAPGRGSDQLAIVKSAPLPGKVPVTVQYRRFRALFKRKRSRSHAADAVNAAESMHRLFVALRPPPAIRAAACSTLMAACPRARWQDDEQLHLTLRFIGEVERPVAEDVARRARPGLAPRAERRARRRRPLRQARARSMRYGRASRRTTRSPRFTARSTRRWSGPACAPERRAYLPHVTLARLPRSAAAGPAIDRWLAAHAGADQRAVRAAATDPV